MTAQLQQNSRSALWALSKWTSPMPDVKMRPASGQTLSPDIESLRGIPMFAALSVAEIDALRRRMRLVVVQQGRAIVCQGVTDTQNVFFVLDGRLEVGMLAGNGRAVRVCELRRGDVFGEVAALEDRARSATVEALTTCRLAIMEPRVFVECVSTNPSLALAMLRLLTRRLRAQTERLLETHAFNLRSRLASELLQLAQADQDRLVVPGPPKQIDLANTLGARRESIARELGRLARAGLLRRERDRLVVEHPAALAALAEGRGEVDVFRRRAPRSASTGGDDAERARSCARQSR